MMSRVIPESSSSVDFYADSILPRRSVKLLSAEINQKGRLQVDINNQVLEYPVDWLRYACQCKECFNGHCLSYTSSIRNMLKSDTSLKTVTANNNVVTIEYANGHVSELNADWLYHRRMTNEGRQERADHIFYPHATPWPEPEEVKIQKTSYYKVTETGAGYEAFATALIRDGIFVITDAPTDRYIHMEFGEKTGLLPLDNHYGTNFIVKHEPNPLNHAYTTCDLDLHVDQPYLSRCPCIQLLHCMKQSRDGGENVMCDGIKAAMVLRQRNPEYYKILTTVKIQQQDLVAHTGQPQFYVATSVPNIVTDDKGEPIYTQLNHAAHSSFFPGTIEECEQYCKALKMFFDILYELSVTIKNNPGDILVFDNKRVMHGRLGYDSSQERLLEGWYLDWDSIYSKLRVTKITQANAMQ